MDKTITLRDVRDRLNTLPESALDHPAKWSGELGASGPQSGTIQKLWLVEEDQYCPDGDFWQGVSDFMPQDLKDLIDKGEEPVVRKGQLVFEIT